MPTGRVADDDVLTSTLVAGRKTVPGGYSVIKDGTTYYGESLLGGLEKSGVNLIADVLQPAWDAAGIGAGAGWIIHLKGKSIFTFEVPLSVSDARIVFEGEGRGTQITGSGNLFNFTGVQINRLIFRDFQAESTAGDVFNFGTTDTNECLFENLYLTANTNGKACFKKPIGSGFFWNEIRHCELVTAVTNVLGSQIDLISNNDGINENQILSTKFVNSGRFAIRIEEQSTLTNAFGNKIGYCTGDPTVGGFIGLYGCQSTVLELPNVYDTSSPTNPQIYLSKTTGNATKATLIKGMYSRAGTAAQPDIKCDGVVAGNGLILIQPNVGQIDYGNWSSCVYIGDQGAVTTNFQNKPATLIELSDGIGRFKDGVGTKHVAGASPTGGQSGDILVGANKIWVNDAGTWKSATVV